MTLSAADFIRIKSTRGLARSSFTVFLTADSHLVVDLAGNYMFTIFNSASLSVTTFTPLSIQLQPVSMTLNIDAYSLTITYSDYVDLTSIYPRAIIFQANSNSLNDAYTLSALSSAASSTGFAISIEINIDVSDMNAMKSLYPLISDKIHSYVSYTSNLGVDWFGNSLLSVNASNAFQITSFIPNLTPPSVQRYTIDMNEGVIELILSETVNVMSANLYDINLQSLPSIRFAAFTNLIGATVLSGSGSLSNVLHIQLTNDTLIYLKYNHIANALTTSYLTFSPGFISDFSGLGISPAYDSSVYGKLTLLLWSINDR